jgi:hypothetical protein
MRDFDFETVPEPSTALVPRAEPELLLPTDFDARVGKLRAEITQMLRHAEPLLTKDLANIEQHDAAVEAGRLLQAMAKNVAEFYKPIKQRIDLLKQPILDMEHEDAESLKTAKERLGVAVQQFEERQAAAEALVLKQNLATAALAGAEGELPLPAIVAATVPAKTRGKVKRSTWHAEVVDFMKLIKAVAAGQVLTMALLPNESYLNKRADSDREGMSIPGVEAHEVKTVHFRT